MNYRRASASILVGSVAGNGVALALTPIITRLYAPASYGEYSKIVALASVFIGVSTFRLEVRAQRIASEDNARAALSAALVTSAVWGLALTALALPAVVEFQVSKYVLCVGALVLIASLRIVGGAKLIRAGRYRLMGTLNFAQGAGTPVAQVVLAMFSVSPVALIAGFGIGRIPWLGTLGGLRWERREIADQWHRASAFRRSAGPSALVNSLAGQVSILAAAVFFNAMEIGILAMAIRILVSPMSLIGNAVASATLGELGAAIRNGKVDITSRIIRSMRDLTAVGAIPCAVLAIGATYIVPAVLGADWADVGPVVRLLTVGAFAQFIVAPFANVLNLTSAHRRLLVWDIVRFVTISLAWLVPGMLGASIQSAVFLYSLSLLFLYTWLAAVVVLEARQQDSRSAGTGKEECK